MKNSEMMNDWTACHDCETCGRYAGVVFVCGVKCTNYIGSFRIILQATVRNCAGMLSQPSEPTVDQQGVYRIKCEFVDGTFTATFACSEGTTV